MGPLATYLRVYTSTAAVQPPTGTTAAEHNATQSNKRDQGTHHKLLTAPDIWPDGAAAAAAAQSPKKSTPHLKPTSSSPKRLQYSKDSGVTISTTGKCLGVGCRYWPSVKISTPQSFRSNMVSMISSSIEDTAETGGRKRSGCMLV